MQTIDSAMELNNAISSIETILNSKDGDFVFDAIKQYKEHKVLDNEILQKFQQILGV